MSNEIMLVSLALIFGSMLSGFATFRMSGMRLMPHFIALILAFILTIGTFLTSNTIVFYLAILFQILAPITVCGTICNIIKTQYQTTGIYSSHLALMGMMIVLAIGNLLLM
ncbi:sugar phosphate permease [Methanococcus maripaludis]|uniref:Sugar phosphate permease n=1 Tax=Methanococcus maripaludis TaxID=39152 RepID=A0A7J9P802_METMI|nr:DUF5400 domain-containing protein [Methanococcus maripaludis]MBA2839582.1 sugar phosphate permease [Methanococcus maripaludis]MBA2852159.1 sugar phosphate permease [Methanococcus maripaludis]MBA2859301.1 sugar phosphate permease [Methanococcus maripaludis]MBB6401489.1 sugar phosphate permease [Methanococcus maripaludis]